MTKLLSHEEKILSNSHFVLRDNSSNSVCTANHVLLLTLNIVKPDSAVNHSPSLFFMQLLKIKLEMYSCCDCFALLFPRLTGRGWGKVESIKGRLN